MADEEARKGREAIPGTQTLFEAAEFGDEVLQRAPAGRGAFAGLAKRLEGTATGPPIRLAYGLVTDSSAGRHRPYGR
jgi:hypothetical protein